MQYALISSSMLFRAMFLNLLGLKVPLTPDVYLLALLLILTPNSLPPTPRSQLPTVWARGWGRRRWGQCTLCPAPACYSSWCWQHGWLEGPSSSGSKKSCHPALPSHAGSQLLDHRGSSCQTASPFPLWVQKLWGGTCSPPPPRCCLCSSPLPLNYLLWAAGAAPHCFLAASVHMAPPAGLFLLPPPDQAFLKFVCDLLICSCNPLLGHDLEAKKRWYRSCSKWLFG